MKLDLIRIAVGVMLGVVGRFLLRQLLIENLNFLLTPVTKAFWSHAAKWIRGEHSTENVLQCLYCQKTFYNMKE